MKIGLIVDKKISQLKSCDLEIIKYLIENSDNDFSLIYLNNIPKLNNRHKTIISLAQKVLLKQFSIERKRLIKANFQLIRDELNKYFNSSSVLEVFPHILNANYQLNETDTKKIENS